MPVPYVRVRVAFDSAPDDPVQAWTDISADVRLTDGISCDGGRADESAQVGPGRLTLVLDNSSGDYTFGNGSSPYSPNVIPGKRIRVDASVDGASWVPRFDGYVDGWPVEWGAVTEQVMVRISATDRLSRFSRLRELRDPLAEELGTGVSTSATTFVLDEPVTPEPPDEDLTPGDSLYPADDLYPSESVFPS